MELLAFAKINLTLEVLGLREDGYHEVRTILQTVDLADTLDIREADGLTVECDDPSLNGEANLVWQAAVALAARAGVPPRARIAISKGIPVGMGLGGGSSDAAAALVGLNRLWDLGLSRAELASLAGKLGSDVPFFLWGGAAVAWGRGEQIQPLPPLSPGLPVTLICPPHTLPRKTATLYSRLTAESYTEGAITSRMAQSLASGAFAPDMLYNVFETVAFSAFPGLDSLYRKLGPGAAPRLRLSGAGPAMFLAPSGEPERRRVSAILRGRGVRTYLVKTTGPATGGSGGASN